MAQAQRTDRLRRRRPGSFPGASSFFRGSGSVGNTGTRTAGWRRSAAFQRQRLREVGLSSEVAARTEGRRGHSRVVLEIAPEKGLVREIEAIGYLLDAHRRIAQQILRLEYHVVVNPFDDRTPGRLTDERGEVFGRQIELRGIECRRCARACSSGGAAS